MIIIISSIIIIVIVVIEIPIRGFPFQITLFEH